MSWKLNALGEIYDAEGGKVQTGPFGSQLHESDYKEFGIPVIMPKDINNDSLNLNSIARISDEDANRLSHHIVQNDDIILPRRGEINKRIIINPETVGALCGTGCIKLRGTGIVVNPSFLFYYLKQKGIVTWIENQAVGATMINLNTSIIRSIPIYYPSNIETQKKIANILSNYDDLIENNNKRIQLLEEMAEEIYKEWFVRMRFPGYENSKFFDKEGQEVPFGSVDALPEGWIFGKIGDLIEIKKGKNITQTTITKGSVPVVAGGLTPAYYHNTPNTKSPTITISASGANSGFVNLYYEDIWASDCSFIDSEMTRLLFFFYSTLKVRQKEVYHLQKGSAQPHVYSKDVMGLSLKYPEVNLLNKFEILIKPFYLEIGILKNKNQILQETRDLLLPRLISGKLSVEDIETETEESLLIAAEPEGKYKTVKK